MKKFNILTLCFLFFGCQLFGQGVFTQIKNSYFEQFPKGKPHFFIKFTGVTMPDDSKKNLTNPTTSEILNNISLGYIVNDAIIIGVNSINSSMDYRVDGQEPIIDSITTYGKNLFIEYSFLRSFEFELIKGAPILKNAYVSLQRPFGRIDNHNLTEMESARIGFGIRYNIFKHLKADLHYDQFLDGGLNEGFKKGKLSLGVVVVI